MPKWIRRRGTGVGVVAWTGTAKAATPTITMGAATRPVSAMVVNSAHGYIQVTCARKSKPFSISRDPAGKWALRDTSIGIPIPYAVGNSSLSTVNIPKKTPGKWNESGNSSGTFSADRIVIQDVGHGGRRLADQIQR